jgi:hypothetical protein
MMDKPKGMHGKTWDLILAALDLLEQERPQTVRQLLYALVSNGTLPDTTDRTYERLSYALVEARKQDVIPWDYIEDRSRFAQGPTSWDDLGDYFNSVRRGYWVDVWQWQETRVICCVEKDTLTATFLAELERYRVPLYVSHGFEGWSSIYEASRALEGEPMVIVLAFADFDPSGVAIVQSLEDKFNFFGVDPLVEEIAVTWEQFRVLPRSVKVAIKEAPQAGKTKGDTRAPAFREQFGPLGVELDAIPNHVLRQLIRDSVEHWMSMPKLAAACELEAYGTLEVEERLREHLGLEDE